MKLKRRLLSDFEMQGDMNCIHFFKASVQNFNSMLIPAIPQTKLVVRLMTLGSQISLVKQKRCISF